MSNPENFSQRLKSARLRLGLTQELFAPLLSISRNYLNMLEGGREPGTKLRQLFDLMESRGRFDLGLAETATPYTAAPRQGRSALLHRCEALLDALHDAQSREALCFGIEAFERAFSRFKDECLFTPRSGSGEIKDGASCATKNTSAASTPAAPAPSPRPTPTANIVDLPPQHLRKPPSSTARRKSS